MSWKRGVRRPTPQNSKRKHQLARFSFRGKVGDDGIEKLKDEISGCGAVTGWDWYEQGGTTFKRVWFNLPLFIKAGCVERAIVSAGGPQLSCIGQGVGFAQSKRELDVGKAAKLLPSTPPNATRPIPEVPSPAPHPFTPSYTYGSTPLSESYEPLWWTLGGGTQSPATATTVAATTTTSTESSGVVRTPAFETILRRTAVSQPIV